MKMEIRCCLLTVWLLGSSVIANAGNGIKRSEWSLRTELSAGDIVIGDIGMFGLAALAGKIYDGEEAPWWFPTMCFRQAYLATPECKDKFLDLGLPDHSIGECITYMSKELPIGFWAKVAYERQGFKPKDDQYKPFSKQMVVPELGIKIRFGNYRTADAMYILDVGVSYDYAFNAKGDYDGKDVVNSGFSGLVGFSYGLPDSHIQIGLSASFPFYHYFNKSFTPDGGKTFPYEKKWSTKVMVMSWSIRYGF